MRPWRLITSPCSFVPSKRQRTRRKYIEGSERERDKGKKHEQLQHLLNTPYNRRKMYKNEGGKEKRKHKRK
jgi:hypothetical protein